MRLKDHDWAKIPIVEKVTADPAAGAEPSTITLTKRSRIHLWGFSILTDGTGANRTVNCYVKFDGATTHMYVVSTTAHTATLTRNYRFVPSMPYGETFSITYYFMGFGASPYIELPAGATITFVITNKQAGDNASVTTYYLQEAPF